MKLTTVCFVLFAALAENAHAEVRDDTRGPQAFSALLARYDAMKPGPERDALALQVDKVAAQRYATESRLFWYTDLEAAKQAAKASGKPILSLRMLGRLDEDLSCANSRYFRIALYANAALSKFLRDKFVLHWSSERPVPRITVDFGDGRKLERTVTGNSVHYVLDAEGRPVDALPGLYAPAVFQRELETSLALVAALRGAPARERAIALAEHHRKQLAARLEQWKQLGKVQVPMQEGFRPEAFAQLTTVTKSGIELPMYRVVDFGVDVGKVPDDAQAWAQVGLRLMPGAKRAVAGSAREAAMQRTLTIRSPYVGSLGQRVQLDAVTQQAVADVLDANSRALLARLQPTDWRAHASSAPSQAFERLVTRFERDILADTAVNEFNVRQAIRGEFINGNVDSLERLNSRIYKMVFFTPADDPWLGLRSTGITALPNDGLVVTER